MLCSKDMGASMPEMETNWPNLAGVAQQVLKVKRLHPDAVMPQYATDGSACFDLHVVGIGGLTLEEWAFVKKHPQLDVQKKPVNVLEKGSSDLFRTGLSFEIPKGYVMLVFSRSGHGLRNDTRLSNCVGVIDSDYRGEVMLKLRNDGGRMLDPEFKPGDRIAQAMLVPIPRVQLVEVDELTDTERGAQGFGSTGQ